MAGHNPRADLCVHIGMCVCLSVRMCGRSQSMHEPVCMCVVCAYVCVNVCTYVDVCVCVRACVVCVLWG